MIKGVFCGLFACALWGLTYLLPVLLPAYDTSYIALSRAFVMGAVSLIIWSVARQSFAVIKRKDWIYATKISIIGNLVQAWFLMLSVQYAGVPIAGICFGGVPVLVALVSNAREKRRGHPFVPLSRLWIPLCAIAVGFILINYTELAVFTQTHSGNTTEFFFGLGCGIISTLMWTWYPIRNADWLLSHPKVSPVTWTAAQCLVLFPLSAIVYLIVFYLDDPMPSLLGPNPLLYVLLMIWAGLFCSWIATVLWNVCSASLPTALVGQLLVFETIFAVVYGHIQRLQWPSLSMFCGTTLLIFGICVALKTFNDMPNPIDHTEDRV